LGCRRPKHKKIPRFFPEAFDALESVLFVKLCKYPVDSLKRLVLDPKNCPENNDQDAPEDALCQNSDLSQSDTRPDTSMEITAERIRDVISDPDYPSYEILLDVAEKLLESFEKK
jgi:hypothetical protein